MAPDSPKLIALLSIRPRYAEKIMAGEKTVEFRKTRFRFELSHVVVYATAPIHKVIGYFAVSAVEEASPGELWARHNGSSGMTHDEFTAYYGSHVRGTAISIGEVRALEEPVSLAVLGSNVTAPQGFMYLDSGFIDVLKPIDAGEHNGTN